MKSRYCANVFVFFRFIECIEMRRWVVLKIVKRIVQMIQSEEYEENQSYLFKRIRIEIKKKSYVFITWKT